MDILKRLSVTLTLSELEEIIKHHVFLQGYELKGTTVELTKAMYGYGTSEHEETVFTGIKIDIERQDAK